MPRKAPRRLHASLAGSLFGAGAPTLALPLYNLGVTLEELATGCIKTCTISRRAKCGACRGTRLAKPADDGDALEKEVKAAAARGCWARATCAKARA